MISKQTLDKALSNGIINQTQLNQLLQLESQKFSTGAIAEEQLRFVRGFGDIFISLGIILVALSFNFTGLSNYYNLVPIITFIVAAEWLIRIKKLSLPGMVILICIIFYVDLLFDDLGHKESIFNLGLIIVTSILFFLRYKMPFSLFPVAASIVLILIQNIGIDIIKQPYLLSYMGIAIFIAAMLFDSRDTQRQNYLSDTAFWLHLLAAPLITHGAMIMIVTAQPYSFIATNQSMFMIGFFILFLFIALFIDRRALLISSTAYAIYAVTQLVKLQVSDTQNMISIVFLIFGIFVIVFGTYWHKARKLLFGWASKTGIARIVPDFRNG